MYTQLSDIRKTNKKQTKNKEKKSAPKSHWFDRMKTDKNKLRKLRKKNRLNQAILEQVHQYPCYA